MVYEQIVKDYLETKSGQEKLALIAIGLREEAKNYSNTKDENKEQLKKMKYFLTAIVNNYESCKNENDRHFLLHINNLLNLSIEELEENI